VEKEMLTSKGISLWSLNNRLYEIVVVPFFIFEKPQDS